MRAKQKNNLLPLIAAFKITKAFLLFTVALGFRHLHGGDVEKIVTAWAHAVRVDPDSRYAHRAISAVTGIPAPKLHELEIGTFLYGLLFLTEGTGLMLGVRWAEYLTVVSTLGFLPLEVYELIEPRHRMAKSIILFLNILIAIYLVWNLKKTRDAEKEESSPNADPTVKLP